MCRSTGSLRRACRRKWDNVGVERWIEGDLVIDQLQSERTGWTGGEEGCHRTYSVSQVTKRRGWILIFKYLYECGICEKGFDAVKIGPYGTPRGHVPTASWCVSIKRKCGGPRWGGRTFNASALVTFAVRACALVSVS